MISILTVIGCIVVVLILMIPPIIFGYAICREDADLFPFAFTLWLIEFVALTIGLIWCVNRGLFG